MELTFCWPAGRAMLSARANMWFIPSAYPLLMLDTRTPAGIATVRDPGNDTGWRFDYQHPYAAIFCCSLLDQNSGCLGKPLFSDRQAPLRLPAKRLRAYNSLMNDKPYLPEANSAVEVVNDLTHISS